MQNNYNSPRDKLRSSRTRRNRKQLSFLHLISFAVWHNGCLIDILYRRFTRVEFLKNKLCESLRGVVEVKLWEGARAQAGALTGTDFGQSIYVNYTEMGINRRPAVHRRVTSEPAIK